VWVVVVVVDKQTKISPLLVIGDDSSVVGL